MIDADTLTSMYMGQSIFSIFDDQKQFYQYIAEIVSSVRFKDEQDEFKKPVQNSVLRKLAIAINTPTLKVPDLDEKTLKKEKGKKAIPTFKTVANRSIWEKQPHLRDSLLEILNKCSDFEITQFVSSQEDMERLVRTQNHMVLKAFKKHWSLQLRNLSEIEEVLIQVSKP